VAAAEAGLTLLAAVGMEDPLRPEVGSRACLRCPAWGVGRVALCVIQFMMSKYGASKVCRENSKLYSGSVPMGV